MKHFFEKLRAEWREERGKAYVAVTECWIVACLIFSAGVLLLRAAGVDA